MNPLELTTAVNTLANAIACNLNDDELAVVSAIFMQLGDTLTTIAATRQACGSANKFKIQKAVSAEQ